MVRVIPSNSSDELVEKLDSSSLVVAKGCSSVRATSGRVSAKVTGSSGLLATARVSSKLGGGGSPRRMSTGLALVFDKLTVKLKKANRATLINCRWIRNVSGFSIRIDSKDSLTRLQALQSISILNLPVDSFL